VIPIVLQDSRDLCSGSTCGDLISGLLGMDGAKFQFSW